MAGENWQISYADHPLWDHKISLGSPSAKMDCETKNHVINATHLCIKAKVFASSNSMDKLKDHFRAGVYNHLDLSPSSANKAAKEYAERYLNAMCVAFRKMANTTDMMSILGKAYSAAASVDAASVNTSMSRTNAAADDANRPVGGHAYPCQQSRNADGSVTWMMGEGTAMVLNRGHSMDAKRCDSSMALEQGHSLVLHSDWIKSQAPPEDWAAPGGNQWGTSSSSCNALCASCAAVSTKTFDAKKVNFNCVMLQSEKQHTGKFYGDALASANALLYSQHHDVKTDKPLKDVIFGSLWFTKNKETGKLSFGGCPEDPYKNNVVFADIAGKVVDSMLPEDVVKAGTTYTKLQQQSVAAVREYAGRKVPEAHWDAWMDRMYVKGKVGELQNKHSMSIPFEEGGKVFRVIVTFESAEALKSFSKPIATAWNSGTITPAIMIQKSQEMMDEIEKTCESWRSIYQMRSKMKCLAHTKKCYEEWQANKNAKFAFASYEVLNCMVLTMSCSVPVREEVFDVFKVSPFQTCIC